MGKWHHLMTTSTFDPFVNFQLLTTTTFSHVSSWLLVQWPDSFLSLSLFPAAWQIDFLMRTAYFAIHTNSYNLTWLAVRERRNFRCLSFVAEHDPSIASGKEEFWCNRDWKKEKLLPERENLPIPYIIYGQEKRAMPRDSLSFGMSLGDIFVCPPTTQK